MPREKSNRLSDSETSSHSSAINPPTTSLNVLNASVLLPALFGRRQPTSRQQSVDLWDPYSASHYLSQEEIQQIRRIPVRSRNSNHSAASSSETSETPTSNGEALSNHTSKQSNSYSDKDSFTSGSSNRTSKSSSSSSSPLVRGSRKSRLQNRSQQKSSLDLSCENSKAESFPSVPVQVPTSNTRKKNVCTWNNCGKAFEKPSALKRHVRTHTGERPFVCEWPTCGLAFSERGNLKRHARIHTGEKPYGCVMNDCPEMFARRSHLLAHIRAQHDGTVTAVTTSSPNGTQLATITGFGGFTRTIPITPKKKNHRRLRTSRSLDLSFHSTPDFSSMSPLSDSTSNEAFHRDILKFNSSHILSPASSYSDDNSVREHMMLTDEQLNILLSDSQAPFFQESHTNIQYNERDSSELPTISDANLSTIPSTHLRSEILTKWGKSHHSPNVVLASATPPFYTPRSSSQSSISKLHFPLANDEASANANAFWIHSRPISPQFLRRDNSEAWPNPTPDLFHCSRAPSASRSTSIEMVNLSSSSVSATPFEDQSQSQPDDFKSSSFLKEDDELNGFREKSSIWVNTRSKKHPFERDRVSADDFLFTFPNESATSIWKTEMKAEIKATEEYQRRNNHFMNLRRAPTTAYSPYVDPYSNSSVFDEQVVDFPGEAKLNESPDRINEGNNLEKATWDKRPSEMMDWNLRNTLSSPLAQQPIFQGNMPSPLPLQREIRTLNSPQGFKTDQPRSYAGDFFWGGEHRHTWNSI